MSSVSQRIDQRPKVSLVDLNSKQVVGHNKWLWLLHLLCLLLLSLQLNQQLAIAQIDQSRLIIDSSSFIVHEIPARRESVEPIQDAASEISRAHQSRPQLRSSRNLQSANQFAAFMAGKQLRGQDKTQIATKSSRAKRRSSALNSPKVRLTRSEESRTGRTKCALILQRTYVKKLDSTSDDYESSNDPNSVEESRLMATGKQERICISYLDVENAIREARQSRKFKVIESSEINSIEPSVPTIAEIGELNQEVSRILALKFDLSADEILNGLPLIDMSRTSFWQICPLMVRPIQCDPSGRFRSFTGHCNNLKNPSWGAAQTPFVRYLAPRHPDGIQMERSSVVDGSPLPSPRLVTSRVHRDHDQASSDLSLLIMVWGQIIDHDVALAAPPRGKSGQ